MKFTYQIGEQHYPFTLEKHGDSYRAFIEGQQIDFEQLEAPPGEIRLKIGTRSLSIFHTPAGIGGLRHLAFQGCSYALEKPTSSRTRKPSVESQGSLRSPMPALVRALQVDVGESVQTGQTLLLLEAMKMEIRLQAPYPGIVRHIHVSAGDTVEKDQLLVELAGVEI